VPSGQQRAPASPSPAIGSNQKVLDARQSARLISWARALRSCLSADGLEAARPRVSRKEIRIPLRSAPAMQVLLARVLRCAEPLGGPPKGSSVQTFETQVILYLPKQCLLDPKVTRRNA
jgi:hypothetical protein